MKPRPNRHKRHRYIIFFRWLLVLIIALAIASVFYFNLQYYLSFSALKKYQTQLLQWTHQYYLFVVLIYMIIYIAVVSLLIPGALFLSVLGGFLFGPIAVLYVVVSATIGSAIIFLAVRSTFGGWLVNKAGQWAVKMQKGFDENAFNYLLAMRLIPLFPFWAVNIAAALLSIRFSTFVLATLIGIIPGAFVYVFLGNGLSTVLAANQEPNLAIIYNPSLLLPLIGLAILACLPVFYKWKKKLR